MKSTHEINTFLINYINSTNKPFITLAEAHKILIENEYISVGEKENGVFKKLLEEQKIDKAVQTNTTPKQWRIYRTIEIEIKQSQKIKTNKINCLQCNSKIELTENNENNREIFCQNCKTFTQNPYYQKGQLSAGSWLWVVLIVIAFLAYNITNSNEQKEITRIEDVYYKIEDYLEKQYLKDPETYESMGWSALQKETNQWYQFSVRHRFRAKNSFGGYVIEEKIFLLDEKGNVLEMLDY